MSKALGFTKSQLNLNENQQTGVSSDPSKIFDFEYVLLNRPECETMYDYVHLIPYITVVNEETREIFVYSRGKGGGESRLHGKCSIGLGGHMEEHLTEKYTIKDAIVECISRELEEEVGLKPTAKMTNLYYQNLNQNNFNIIYDPTDDVGKVHLGISMFVKVDPKAFGEVEQGVIERGQWMSVEDLHTSREEGNLQLENWSSLLLDIILKYQESQRA